MPQESKFYLEDIPLDEAWRRFATALESAGLWSPLPGEPLALREALGRVTAEPIWAALSSPGYHASAMDGYAVRSIDTVGATETSPRRLKVGPDGPAHYVDTGDPIPSWADAVIMIEQTQRLQDDDARRIHRDTGRRGAGSVGQTDGRGHGRHRTGTARQSPAEAGGPGRHRRMRAPERRRAASAARGDHTDRHRTDHGRRGGGSRPEIGRHHRVQLVWSWPLRSGNGAASPTRVPIVVDDYERIKAAVLEAAADHDLVLVNAGASSGSEDFTASIVEELGTLLVHGVAVRPGHPVILGLVNGGRRAGSRPSSACRDIPVSCALTGEIFVEPLLSHWLGVPARQKPRLQATITRKILSPTGDDEWVRVTVGRVGERTVAAPLSRGAGVITSLVRADGIVHIPRFLEGVEAGQEVTVELYRDAQDVDRTIVHIGSHDLCLDLLAQLLAEAGRRFSSANAGSLGGLLAVGRGDAHLAGSHLLDPETGEYNVSYVKKHLPGRAVVLVNLVHREQGLIIAPGNPKGITGLADLARDDIRYVNRQRGAGTRVLLDYHLGKLGIPAERVHGYAHEEYTHLAVAVAVQSGAADCGLGIAAAAHALGLDFIPFAKERYDLVIPRVHYDAELLGPLLELIRGPELRRAVAALPGYDTSEMGKIMAELE